MKWSYGVTTVPKRRKELLPHTLGSLRLAGFDQPRLFVDGCDDPKSWKSEFGLEVTARDPEVRTAGNWILSLYELYLREPSADRYAIFQDDLITYKNLQVYLEKCKYPELGYWNLYTFPENQTIINKEYGGAQGWHLSNQFGRGAVGLVFSRYVVTELLATKHMAERPQDVAYGWRKIDGGIVTALAKCNPTIKEYVHNPSLVQHTGILSTMRNRKHPLATSFQGMDFDALDLLKQNQ